MALVRPQFDRAEQASRLRVPLLVVHGEADQVCPVEDGTAIAAGAAAAKLAVIPGGGHRDLFTDPRFRPASEAAVKEFLHTLRRSGRV
jgi:pimeloyl-ACP methyl ester carboxylesterase